MTTTTTTTNTTPGDIATDPEDEWSEDTNVLEPALPDAVVVLCTAPADDETGPRLARGMVDAGLVACVNLIPGLRSFYRWRGEVADDQETLLVIKTRAGRVPELTRWIQEAHPYDVPEVVALPVTDGARPYLRWVVAESDPG
ncbi:MAG TPA: divalent-cation tolerance protein CutA [Polyangiaceae bacterium LLY-WYZ-14_1]|nr:divalent-cation tolerance protein CutA [Polyangiaceae bacterium LLY-WYZ-14_1]